MHEGVSLSAWRACRLGAGPNTTAAVSLACWVVRSMHTAAIAFGLLPLSPTLNQLVHSRTYWVGTLILIH